MPDSVAASEKNTGGRPPNPETAVAASESILFEFPSAPIAADINLRFYFVFRLPRVSRAFPNKKSAKKKSLRAARPAAQF